MAEVPQVDPLALQKLAQMRMPFGKYAGRYLIDLPESYVLWLVRNNLPAGALGQQLLEIYEIKVNGLESLLRPFLQKNL